MIQVFSYIFIFFFAILSQAHGSITHIHFPIIDSTQIYAKAHAPELVHAPGEWAIVTSDIQTNGMGCFGRTWESFYDGNLYVTFVTLYPKTEEENLSQTLFLSALAVSKTLRDYGVDAGIKWVNDVLVNHKKISGSLCEILPSPYKDYEFLFLGIGININMSIEEAELISNATSTLIETGYSYEKDEIIESLYNNLQELLDRLISHRGNFLEEYYDHMLYVGEEIDVEVDFKSVTTGKLLGIDKRGALLVQDQHLNITRISNGRILSRYK